MSPERRLPLVRLMYLERPTESIHLFFFIDTADTEIYTLSLHDALPIYPGSAGARPSGRARRPLRRRGCRSTALRRCQLRSEEHTSELQSLAYLVCRLLLEKKNDHEQQKYVPFETTPTKLNPVIHTRTPP